MSYRFIAIEGNIGAGKTTLSQMMSQALGAHQLLESFKDNPFLPKFYEEPRRHAFSLELSFLAERYHQLKAHFSAPDLFQEGTVSDYFIGKSLVFAKNNLEEDELRLFRSLYDIMFANLPRPDLLIYLHRDIEGLQQNIKKRGRSYEQDIEDDYLSRVQRGYLDYLKQQTDLRTVVMSLGDTDFVRDKTYFDRILSVVHRNYPRGVSYIDPRRDI